MQQHSEAAARIEARLERERDLLGLVRAGYDDLVDGDPAMLELFDLEWRLDEVTQHSARFRAPHTGGADDREALAGLREELERA